MHSATFFHKLFTHNTLAVKKHNQHGATQKMLFGLPLHQRKPSESSPQSLKPKYQLYNKIYLPQVVSPSHPSHDLDTAHQQ
jgi:hypothetical protein